MKHLLSILSLFIALAPLTFAQDARPDAAAAARFAQPQTLVVAHISVSQIDLDAAEKQLVQAIERAGGQPAAPAADAVREAAKMARDWKDQFIKAGGRDVYAFLSLEDWPAAPGYLVATHAPDANTKTIASLLFSGHPDGPTQAEPVDQQPGNAANAALVAQSIKGGVYFGTRAGIKRLADQQAANRPDLPKTLADAFSAAGDAPLRVVLTPTDDLRKLAAAFHPKLPKELGAADTASVAQQLAWIAVSARFDPAPAARIVLNGTDAPAAQNLKTLLERAIQAGVAAIPAANADVRKTLASLSPQINETRVTLDIEGKTAEALAAGILAPSLLAARRSASLTQSSNNIRQLILGMYMHAEEHQGQLPDTLDALVAEKRLPAQILTNPRAAQATPGYIYIRPADRIAAIREPSRTIILHEPFDIAADNGRIVAGFADGHTEILPVEQVKELLTKSAAK